MLLINYLNQKKRSKSYYKKVDQRIQHYRIQFFNEHMENKEKKSKISENAIPICSDITHFDFAKL